MRPARPNGNAKAGNAHPVSDYSRRGGMSRRFFGQEDPCAADIRQAAREPRYRTGVAVKRDGWGGGGGGPREFLFFRDGCSFEIDSPSRIVQCCTGIGLGRSVRLYPTEKCREIPRP